MDGLRVRSVLALTGIVVALIWLFPNFVNMENKWWFSKDKINYGLDIQGGLHLVMGVDVDSVVAESAQRMAQNVKSEASKEGLSLTDVKTINPKIGEIEISFSNKDDKSKVVKFVIDKFGTSLQELTSTETSVNFRFFEAYLSDYKNKVILQSIETLRNRIDEFGVAEPSITQQGDSRILIQLPGMADAEKAKALINTTAKLDFMIVNESIDTAQLTNLISEVEKAGSYSIATTKYSDYITKLNSDLKGKIPEKTFVYFEKAQNAKNMEAGAIPILLNESTGLTGGDLDDAYVGYGQYGEPEVLLSFNPAGAQKFSDITGNNVGKRMAVVLDKVIKTAPNIKDKISGGRASITLGGAGRDRQGILDEAKMISTALRAGALPASLEQLEERRIGPTLGSDSVNSAKVASYIGAIVIILFMIFYYKAMGVVSAISILINVLSGLAILTSLGATLTLPGIAGIALTVGFAVDANVLINERIREELKNGAGLIGAIAEGYKRAMSAILDANAMTAATAIVLLYFGTGPVKGFAVTLLIGIATTLFANVFVSKVIVDNLIHKFGFKKISV